jgi:hypothetical protein
MNTPIARTTGAIALTPTGNAQGKQYFMSLAIGRKLSRQQWDELPMPDGVIETAERMVAQAEHQPLLGRGAPIFEWSPGVAIEDDKNIPTIQDDDVHVEGIEGENEGADEFSLTMSLTLMSASLKTTTAPTPKLTSK